MVVEAAGTTAVPVKALEGEEEEEDLMEADGEVPVVAETFPTTDEAVAVAVEAVVVAAVVVSEVSFDGT